MSVELVRDWVTKAGLPARVYRLSDKGGPKKYWREWLCGYVRVPPGHPLHGVDYNEPTLAIQPEWILEQPLGKRSPIAVFTALAIHGVKALNGESVARTPELLFDVHGGLTWSGKMEDDPEGWWFGFDAAHYNDEIFLFPELLGFQGSGRVRRSVDYMAEDCERLAEQIVRWFPLEVHNGEESNR